MGSGQHTSVAEALHRNQKKILQLWTERVRQSIPAASGKSKAALQDALPIFLGSLIGALSPLSPTHQSLQEAREVSREHGEQRARFNGYSISEVIAEYTLLQKTILEVLEVQTGGPLNTPERDIILDHIMEGIKEAAAEFTVREADNLKDSNRRLQHFAETASHDLREPLRMIASYLKLLEKRFAGNLDDQSRSYFHFAVDGAARMKALIESLLLYSQVGEQSEKASDTDLNQVLADVRRNLEVAIHESSATVTSDPLPNVVAYRIEITRLFQNLISNALKFREKGPPHIHISAARDAAGWTVSVADNGVGVDAEHRQRIFEPFTRLHSRNKFPGSGLGLSIAKRVVELHSGRLWVEPNPEGGSIFKFTIPESSPAA